MKIVISLVLVVLVFAGSATAITIDTVPVGDVGNPNDPSTGNLYGGVNYAYSIGKYEVTVGQYTAFLNAVAATDTYTLYRTSYATDPHIAGIARTGSSGNYTYSVIGSPNKPATYMDWGDAARFANWLHNGQPAGPQGPGTTETGAYTLNGATSGSALMAVSRNSSATWFITSENEWYKAAYYQPAAHGGDSDGYWAYPMRTNSEPYSDQPPGATPDDARVGNFYKDDGLSNGYNDGYSVTGSPTLTSTNYLTDVGAYTASSTYYGTFDQGGNLYEWMETATGPYRGIRGGSWRYASMHASNRFHNGPDYDTIDVFGFRVATTLVLEPSSDFDHDGFVDAADYVVWRKRGGSAAEYNNWRFNFGRTSGSATGLSSNVTVPEPADALLLLLGLLMMSASRRTTSLTH